MLEKGQRTADPKAAPVPPERIMVLMHRIVARAAEVGNSEVRQFGFNVQGSRVLVALLERGPLRAGELGSVVALDSSTLSHLLRRIERLGLTERKRVESDNRSVNVTLTRKGRAIAAKCKSISLRIEASLLRGLAPAEIVAARQLLGCMCENAERELPLSMTRTLKPSSRQQVRPVR